MFLRALGAIILIGSISAVSAQAETLTEALAKAYLTNPALVAERARLRAIDEGVPLAESGNRPAVSARGTAGASRVDSNSAVRNQNRLPKSVALSIDQPLYLGGRTGNAIREAEYNVQAGRARLTSAEQNVLVQVIGAYMSVLRDQALVDLNNNNTQVLRRHLDATRDRFRVGEITRTDVNQAEARLALSIAQGIRAKGDLDASRALYRDLVGDFPGMLEPPPPPPVLLGSAEDAVRLSMENNPDIMAAEYLERAQAEQVEQNLAELLPTLSLQGSAGRSLQTTSEISQNGTIEGLLVLTVPLYQRGAEYATVRSSRQVLAQLRNQTEDTRREAVRTATSAWATLESARAQIGALQTAITASQVALEGVEREAQVGSRTLLDVLDAQQELLDSQVQLVVAQRDLMVAIFQLKATFGEVTARSLNLPVEYYDPALHYEKVKGKWFGFLDKDEALER
jgi:outer membrane protein